MSKKSKKQVRKQVPSSAGSGLVPRLGQMLLPMIAGIAATKADLAVARDRWPRTFNSRYSFENQDTDTIQLPNTISRLPFS